MTVRPLVPQARVITAVANDGLDRAVAFQTTLRAPAISPNTLNLAGAGAPVEARQCRGIGRWRECGAEGGATEIDRRHPVRLADHGCFLAQPAGSVSGSKIPTPAFQECDVVAKLCA